MSREGTPPVNDVQVVVGRNRPPPATGWRLYSLKYQVTFPPLDQVPYHCIPRIEPPGDVPAGKYAIKYEDRNGQPIAREDGKADPQIEIGEHAQVIASPVDHATYEERMWQETARREANNLRRASFVTENKRLVETIASREQSMAATLATMMQMVAQQTQLMAKQTELQGQSQKELLEQTARLIKEATSNLHAPTPPPPPADYASVLNNLIAAATTVVTTGMKESSRARRRLNSILIGEDRGPRKKPLDKQPASTLPAAASAPPVAPPEAAPAAVASAPPAATPPSAPPEAAPMPATAPAPAQASAPAPAQASAPTPVAAAPSPATPSTPSPPIEASAVPSPAAAPQPAPAAQPQPDPADPTKRAAGEGAALARVVDRPRKWSRAKAWYEVKRRFFSMSEGTMIWLISNPRYLLHFVNSLAELCVPPAAEVMP